MGPHDSDQLDDLVDGALKQYGEVEPRAGLEGRVLAKLRAEQRLLHWWTPWAWGLALAGSICAAIVVLTLMKSPHARQPVAVHPQNASTETAQNVAADPQLPGRTVVPHSNAKSQLPQTLRRPREFPSPRPLSEQETMLVDYVERYPQEAILVAKEQDEFQRRVEQAEKEMDASSSSDQQER